MNNKPNVNIITNSPGNKEEEECENKLMKIDLSSKD